MARGGSVVALVVILTALAGCTSDSDAEPDDGDAVQTESGEPVVIEESFTGCSMTLLAVSIQKARAQQVLPLGYDAADFSVVAATTAGGTEPPETGDGLVAVAPLYCPESATSPGLQLGLTMVGVQQPAYDENSYDFYPGQDQESQVFYYMSDVTIQGSSSISTTLQQHGLTTFGGVNTSIYDSTDIDTDDPQFNTGTTYRNVRSSLVDDLDNEKARIQMRELRESEIQGASIAYWESSDGSAILTIPFASFHVSGNPSCNFAPDTTMAYLIGSTQCSTGSTTISGYVLPESMDLTLTWLPDTFAADV